jgi:hypothetical protein
MNTMDTANIGRRGQAMLIAILVIGGAMLGATALAGFLTLANIRDTTNVANSAKAIEAADAGVNWALYVHFNPPQVPQLPFANGASSTVICSDSSGTTIDCDQTASTTAISRGSAGDSRRAFFVNLTSATSVFP